MHVRHIEGIEDGPPSHSSWLPDPSHYEFDGAGKSESLTMEHRDYSLLIYFFCWKLEAYGFVRLRFLFVESFFSTFLVLKFLPERAGEGSNVEPDFQGHTRGTMLFEER